MIRAMYGILVTLTIAFAVALLFVTVGQRVPTLNGWRVEANAWIGRHGMHVDLSAIWSLSVAYTVYMLANLGIWAYLSRQRDKSDVGRALKLLKLTQAMMGAGMGLLFSIALWAYYAEYTFTPLQELIIIAFVVSTCVAASVTVVMLGVVLWQDNRALRTSDD